MNLKEIIKNKNLKTILVIAFILIFSLATFVSLRGSYLEYKELGENYLQIYETNLRYKYIIMLVNFVLLFTIIYFTNRGIKKGIKPFFEQDKIEVPKLPNKSIALVIAAIVSVIFSNQILEKILLVVSNTTFQMTDPVFNLDISYYLFIKPVIEFFISYFNTLIIGITVYMSAYYIIVFNVYCNGVDRNLLKKSLFFKKICRNVVIWSIGMGISYILKAQNVVLDTFITLKNSAETELTGAGFIEAAIKSWGYALYSIVVVVVASFAVKYFKKEQARKVLATLAVIPAYYIILFLIVVGVKIVYVSPNELDIERDYISENIKFTQRGYNISLEEINIENSGTITLQEAEQNMQVIENIPVVSEQMVINTLQETQTETGYYNYRNATMAKYEINGKEEVVYIAPREITNSGTTYNYKTYEYTHGNGKIAVSATEVTDIGSVKYFQKDIEGSDNVLKISQPRIYFGMETNDTIVINSKNKKEYDYTDSEGNQIIYKYTGDAGLNLNFGDRLILAMKEGDIKLALSTAVSDESKILINRNIRERAKKALPYLMYDENPYTVIDNNGDIYWVLDAYTTSSSYPYSTYTQIEYEGEIQKINYIRNSVKVIINAYDGTMKFYITDKYDPIVMAYRKLYPDLFENIDSEIPEDISSKFVYPEFLFNVQAKILEVYHNVKPEVLYRENDIWQFATYNTTQTNKVVGTTLESYSTVMKTVNNDTELFGRVQMYTKDGKSNIIAYLVGIANGAEQELTLYKFSSDSNVLGPTQLDSQIEQDDVIAQELEELNVTGAKITKQIIIVPINNTLLYVEPVYQTILNESNVPTLEKVIVASGTKMAIGNNLQEALANLLSQEASNIEIDRTDDLEGILESIIEANKNLTESGKSNNWEMLGSDLQELQDLISALEKMMKENEQNEKESDDSQLQDEQISDGEAKSSQIWQIEDQDIN